MDRNKTITFSDVREKCETYMTSDDLEFIEKAYIRAKDAHEGQMRKSGDPFIVHPTHVASYLADLQLDPATVATGFLHDVVEDTEVTLEEIEEEFGSDVAQLVDGVTKIGKYRFESKEQAQAENHRKMLLAMGKDIRVILVKLADRLHNMRTLEHHRPEKQRRIARETLDIYAPLAERLGIYNIKWQLEDISLRYLNPQQYYRIVHQMNSRREEREEYIQNAIDVIQESLDEMDIKAEITGRPKHIYSIYQKMVDQKKQFQEIYDLMAVRVITDSVKDCYAVLGAIHANWKPIPGRFKDYIAMPKENLYQSLHTTVLGPKATTLEVQIRTHEMHEVAEYGVAAHWAYKEGKTAGVNPEDQLNWQAALQDYQDESDNAEEFMESVKQDLLADKVYVFTPNNDVVELPAGASTLDFAYHIHTEVGNKSTGAKVNGKIVSLNYKLSNGDVVEMITSSSSYGPSRDWLKYVNTSKAKNRIRRFFKVQDKEKNVDQGRDRLEEELREAGYKPKQVLNRDRLDAAASRFNFKDDDEFYAAIGFGEIRVSTVVQFLTKDLKSNKDEEDQQPIATEDLQKTASPEEKKQKEKLSIKHDSGIVVEGGDNLLIRLSGCCNPVPGDEIIGYVTKGRGISVHRKDCPNVDPQMENAERLIEVDWEDTSLEDRRYDAELQITGFDRAGLFNEVVQVFSNMTQKYNISNIHAHVDPKTNTAVIRLTITISNTKDLRDIVDKIKTVPDIYSVERVVS